MKLTDIIVTIITLMFIIGGIIFGEHASKICEKENADKIKRE